MIDEDLQTRTGKKTHEVIICRKGNKDAKERSVRAEQSARRTTPETPLQPSLHQRRTISDRYLNGSLPGYVARFLQIRPSFPPLENLLRFRADLPQSVQSTGLL